MGSKKLQVWLPLLISLTMVLGMFLGYQLRERTEGSRFLNFSKRTSLQEVVELIKGKYVDKVSSDSVNQMAVNELLSHLDPHSILIPSKDLNEVNDEIMGNFQGIGVEYQMINDTLNVMSVIQGGPSDKAGIRVGDQFISASDSLPLSGKKLSAEQVRSILKGKTGTTVKLKLIRNGVFMEKTISRDQIQIPSIDVSYMLNSETGFIRINRFSDRTYEAFMEAMGKLQKQGMKQLLLDLRGNGGGLMKEAIAIADEFLSEDKLIVYTEGDRQPRVDSRCRKDGIFETGKLVVLVDETSASASEVLSGALQDWDRATIIGRRTFGKGLVQQQFQLSDGSAVRLTVARYFSPLGRNIQKPYGKDKEAYQEELMERFHNGSITKADTAKPVGKPYKTPGGHLVYGGGGITPDIFVPLDTAGPGNTLLKLYLRNTLNHFIYHYYLQNRQRFDQIKSASEMIRVFIPGEKEFSELRLFAKMRDGIDVAGFSAEEKVKLSQRIQVLMARQIWRTEGYFEVANVQDVMIQKALASFKADK